MPEYPAEPVSNCQPQAQAFLGACLVTVEAFELLEDYLTFVFRNARPAIPDFQAELPVFASRAQQHRTFGVAKGVGQEVLQNPPQQFDIAVDPQTAATQAQ